MLHCILQALFCLLVPDCCCSCCIFLFAFVFVVIVICILIYFTGFLVCFLLIILLLLINQIPFLSHECKIIIKRFATSLKKHTCKLLHNSKKVCKKLCEKKCSRNNDVTHDLSENEKIQNVHNLETQIVPEIIIIHSCGEPKISLGIFKKY